MANLVILRNYHSHFLNFRNVGSSRRAGQVPLDLPREPGLEKFFYILETLYTIIANKRSFEDLSKQLFY